MVQVGFMLKIPGSKKYASGLGLILLVGALIFLCCFQRKSYRLNLSLEQGVSISLEDINELIEDINVLAHVLELGVKFDLDSVTNEVIIGDNPKEFFNQKKEDKNDPSIIYFYLRNIEKYGDINAFFDDNYIQISETDFKNPVISLHEIFHYILLSLEDIYINKHNVANDAVLLNKDGCNNLMYEEKLVNSIMLAECQKRWINEFRNGRNLNPQRIFNACETSHEPPCSVEHFYPRTFVEKLKNEPPNCCNSHIDIDKIKEALKEEIIAHFGIESKCDDYLTDQFYNNLEVVLNNSIGETCFLSLSKEEIDSQLRTTTGLLTGVTPPSVLVGAIRSAYYESVVYGASYLDKKQFLRENNRILKLESEILFPNNLPKRERYIDQRIRSKQKYITPHKNAFYNSLNQWTQKMPNIPIEEIEFADPPFTLDSTLLDSPIMELPSPITVDTTKDQKIRQ